MNDQLAIFRATMMVEGLDAEIARMRAEPVSVWSFHKGDVPRPSFDFTALDQVRAALAEIVQAGRGDVIVQVFGDRPSARGVLDRLDGVLAEIEWARPAQRRGRAA